jgi:hypothetical protein
MLIIFSIGDGLMILAATIDNGSASAAAFG